MRVQLPILLAITGLLRGTGSDYPTGKGSVERAVLSPIVGVPCFIGMSFLSRAV